jgi:hypothetical protein
MVRKKGKDSPSNSFKKWLKKCKPFRPTNVAVLNPRSLSISFKPAKKCGVNPHFFAYVPISKK